MCVLCGVADWWTESQVAMAPSQCGLYGTPTPWDPSQVWWHAQGRLRPRQPPAPSPISGLLDSVLTPGSGGGGGESAVAAAQGYYRLKLIHAQVTAPAPPGVEHTVDLVEIDGRTAIASADRLDGLQRRLEAYIRQLSENMDTEPESIQEEQPMLDELIRVNEKILDGIQQFQSFEKMRCREEDEEKEKVTERMLNASTSGAAGTTLVTVAKQQEVQEALSEASSLATAPATAVTNVAEPPLARTNDVLQTLREAREALQLFYLLQQDIRASSAQVADRTLLGELRVVAERLEDLKKNVQTLINAKMRETSADLTGEAEANLASLTSVNEELLRCVENYRRYGIVAERLAGLQKRVHALISGSISVNSAGTAEENEMTLANLTDVNDQLLHCLKNYQRTVQIDESQETPGQTLGATGAEAKLTTGSNAPEAPNYLPTGAVAENPILAMDAVEPAEADRNEGSRMISERTLVLQAREAIEQFNALHGDARMSTAQMTEMTQMRELETIGGRLVGLQQKVQGLINEKLCGNSGGTSEEHETALENLMGLNDELHHCVENYQRALREAEPYMAFVTHISIYAPVIDAAIDRLPKVEINADLDLSPSLQVTIGAVQQLSSGKAPASDGIPAEIYEHGEPQLTKRLKTFFQEIWCLGQVSRDFKDATIVHLYKRKRNRRL
ncbi:unnamed protein product [Schistocephalus solidus]|uniref:Dynactin subunit 2 n=1 Tax=Schistocephalus solidus TaxID=70667 RepID=A0A183STD3_SCHSO|nr:unnamed protein product [Schistocephalus solidus]